MSKVGEGFRLPNIPGFQESGLTTLFSRTTSHMLYIDPDGGSEKYRLVRPDASGDTRLIASSHDLEEIERVYAEAWIREVAVEIGIGFHPDTSADMYSPPLPEPLASDYDAVIGLAFDRGVDPYAAGMDAWRQAGLIEPSPGTPAP